MISRDPRVDAYMAKSAEFAKPILEHLRAVVHAACPDTEENIKWGFPHFGYRGGMLCSMAAFKQHCSFGIWHYKTVADEARDEDGMGHFGRITSLNDLPSKKILTEHIRKAMALTDSGVKPARAKIAPKPPAQLPADFAALLKKHAAARKTYEGFSPSAQREYIDWIVDAKTDATREKRMATALEWMAEGKHRNWKYMK